MKKHTQISLFDLSIALPAAVDAFKKLNPLHQIKNPVMFVVLVGSVLTTGLWVQACIGEGEAPAGFIAAITLWLWFTLLFANFSSSYAKVAE